MEKILIALDIVIKVIGFFIAEVVPFGRAIQKLFKKKEDDKKI